MDTGLFNLINSDLTHPALDWFFVFLTDQSNFTVPIVMAAALLVSLGNRRDRWTIVLVIAAVALADLFSTTFKNLIARPRPCVDIEGVRLFVGCGKAFSMPSGHATNIFSAMVLLTTRYRRLAPVFLGIAALVAYSRVYVGVHYPSDVLAGATLGATIALGLAYLDARLGISKLTPCRIKQKSSTRRS